VPVKTTGKFTIGKPLRLFNKRLCSQGIGKRGPVGAGSSGSGLAVIWIILLHLLIDADPISSDILQSFPAAFGKRNHTTQKGAQL